MTKTWEEVDAEITAYYKSKGYKFDQAYYRVRRILTSPLRWRHNLKHWYQRANRGYADCDAWSGDTFLAGQIAGIMNWIVVNGHGVSMSYADDGLDTPVDIMVERRNAEYAKYGAIFAEYAKNGPAWNEEWLDKHGGVLDKDMEEALQWLSKHFSELWD